MDNCTPLTAVLAGELYLDKYTAIEKVEALYPQFDEKYQHEVALKWERTAFHVTFKNMNIETKNKFVQLALVDCGDESEQRIIVARERSKKMKGKPPMGAWSG